jgi:TDG/mug DNA glycosylase family protein
MALARGHHTGVPVRSVSLPRTPTSSLRALVALHRSATVGQRVAIHAAGATWRAELMSDLLVGAGFTPGRVRIADDALHVTATRQCSLPDTISPKMRLLVCGLNPSVYAAEAGVGFARPGNRYWPAALEAGIVTQDRDPDDALRSHAVGMTDLVKRATPRADELTAAEYRAGLARVGRLTTWLRPGAICFVGLAGWRIAQPKARAGVQDETLGGRPVYVMPSTSGLNARVPMTELAAHLRAAYDLGCSAGAPSVS